MKIFVVAALHGDEVFGLKIIGKLQEKYNSKYIVRVGHPEAVAKGKRYLAADLNRSFGLQSETPETNLATTIKREVEATQPTYIIDIHTSVSNVAKVAIVARNCAKTYYLAETLGMEAVVIMPPSLTKNSLIGQFPDKSISIELGKNQRSDKLAQYLATNIDALEPRPKKIEKKLSIFKVVSVIDKNFDGLNNIANLKFNKKLNGYPFLAGVNTYKYIGGFLAQRIK